jgi:hypothetical protein
LPKRRFSHIASVILSAVSSRAGRKSDEVHKLRVDCLNEPWWLRLLAFMGERYERFLLETAHLGAPDHEGATR